MVSVPHSLFINGRFLAQPITGVQRYAREVLKSIDQLITQGVIALPARARLVCLVPRGIPEPPAWQHIAIQECGRLQGNLWEQLDLPRAVRGGALFSPTNIGPYFTSGQVVTIHDASVFAVPQAYSAAFRLKYRLTFQRFAKTARRIITVSEFSRKELLRYCRIPEEKITVIPHGHEHLLEVSPEPSILEKLPLHEKPFFLAVGSQSPHKNFGLILEALRRMPQEDFKVVIAGGTFARVFQGGQQAFPDNFIPAGYVSDGELRSLYQNARAFIFPSLYEGFGLPVLEAMAFGCPVLCSNAASLPEVGGDAVTYFDPHSPAALAAAMQAALAQPDTAAQLRTAQVKKFSWAKTAQETWQAVSLF